MVTIIPLESLHIRPDQPSDKTPILAFCQHTWADEADYIPGVWDVWFADPTGHILVADRDGQPVGMTRLVQLSDTEGWWEALRVDRDFRRQGIGHQLTQSTLSLAQSLGLTTLRTCVSLTNASMHSFMQHWGFSPLDDYAAPVPPPARVRLQPCVCCGKMAAIVPGPPSIALRRPLTSGYLSSMV